MDDNLSLEHHFDQMTGFARSYANIIATFYGRLREAGMSEEHAGKCAEMYAEAFLRKFMG